MLGMFPPRACKTYLLAARRAAGRPTGMWTDEEIVLFIREYGSKTWVMYSLMALLGVLLLLNYKMWRRLQRARKSNEVHVEWTDAEDEVELQLSLPVAVTATDIRVESQPASLKVFMKMGTSGKWEAKPLMEVGLTTRRPAAPHPAALLPLAAASCRRLSRAPTAACALRANYSSWSRVARQHGT